MRAALLVALMLLSGCTAGGSSSTSVSKQTDTPWDATSRGTVTCRESTALTGSVNATAGSVSIVVLDGKGETTFSVVTGRVADIDRDLVGAAGEWSLEVAGNGFTGSFMVSLAC